MHEQKMVSITAKEDKGAKLRRHEENEKQREMQKKQLTPLKVEVPLQVNVPLTSSTPQPTTQNLVLHIRDLYSLGKTSKKVDDEIENDTWKFTRENLIAYFEDLECVAKEGGKHKKVSLPKAIIVSFEGSTLSIINDLAGSLTLPRWDGTEGNGQVPDYLRKQILKAREKLVALKQKTNSAQNL